jgi:hypothetical protein
VYLKDNKFWIPSLHRFVSITTSLWWYARTAASLRGDLDCLTPVSLLLLQTYVSAKCYHTNLRDCLVTTISQLLST